MAIPAIFGTLAYHGISALFKMGKEKLSEPADLADTAKNTDQVSLSAAGKALLDAERASKTQLTPAQERLLRAARSDSAGAEALAYNMAISPSTIFYDLSKTQPNDALQRLSSTGRPVDEAFKHEFFREAAGIDAQRLALYTREKEKGTHPVEILQKMMELTNQQSKNYLEATGWMG